MDDLYVRVLYQYNAANSDELSASEGDIIKITGQYNEHWYYGQINDCKGLFPVSYTTQITSDLQHEIFIVSETYHANNPNELSLVRGEKVQIIEEVNNDWLRGDVHGRIGIFPFSYVEKLYDSICPDEDDNDAFYANTACESQEGLSVEALYSFTARNTKELSFPEGAIINIIKDLDDDWYEGSFDGRSGLFPKSYVQLYQDIYEVPPTPCARSIYPFVGESESELTFKEGEIILLRKRAGSQWLEGEIDGVVGLFPASFVDIEIDLPPDTQENTSSIPPQKVPLREGLRMKALYHFSALHPGDLALNEGDIVTIVKVVDDNWVEARVNSGVCGMCPSAYLISVDGDAMSNGVPDSSQSCLFKQLQAGIIAREKNSPQSSSFSSLSPGYDWNSSPKGDDSTDSVFVSAGHYWDGRASFHKSKPAPKPPASKSQSYETSCNINGGDGSLQSRSLSMSYPLQSKSTSTNTSPSKSSIYAIPFKSSQTRVAQFRGKSASAGNNTTTHTSEAVGYHRNSDYTNERTLLDMSVSHRASTFNLACPLVPLPTNPSTTKEAIVPKRKAPPPPRKTLSDQKPATLPRTTKNLSSIDKGSERYGSTSSINSGGSNNSDKSANLKPAWSLETSHKKRPPPPPTRNNKDKFNGFTRSATVSVFSRDSYKQDRADGNADKPNSPSKAYSVYYTGQDQNEPNKVTKANSLENISQSSNNSNAATMNNAKQRDDVLDDEEDSTDIDMDTVNAALIPGIQDLDKKIANAEHNQQVEWRACTGMKTILQMLVHDDDKHKEMQVKISRSEQKINEWKDIINGLKNERSFLIKSYPKRKRIEDSIAMLEADLQKQVRSQKSLQVLLDVVENSRKEEVLENISVCDTIIADLQTKITDRKESLQSLNQPKSSKSAQEQFADQRKKVVNELVHTEQDYLRDLQLCLKYFAEELKNSKVVEADVLFGNIGAVVDTSSRLLANFEQAIKDNDVHEQELGKCFVDMADEIKDVYGQYCRNHDDAIGLLEKYEDVPEAQEVFNKCLNAIRDSTKCWDLSSFLIKPVQRVLKYPLLLSELLKCTPEIHKDKHNLVKALSVMNDVATEINEVKRRKDIVLKYKRVEESGITKTFQKLNWHSVLKKSSRINQRLTQMTGLVSQTVDKRFNEQEKKFILLEKAVKNLIKNVMAYMEQFQETRSLQCVNGDNIQDYYQEAATCTEVALYQSTLKRVNNELTEKFDNDVQRLVLSPLNALLALFQGPQRLIQKRQHKCLDYDSRSNRIDKIKDKDKLKTAKSELEKAKKDYEALNTQLLEELPVFYDKTLELVKDCVLNLMQVKRKFHAVFLGEYTNLMLLPLVKDEGDIIEQQTRKTQMVVEQLADLSFIPQLFLGKELLKKKREAKKQPLIPLLPASTGDVIPGQKDSSQSNRAASLSRKRMAPQPPPRAGSVHGRNQEKPKPVPRRNTIHSPITPTSTNTIEITASNFEPYVAISTFDAQNPGELSINEGDLVTIQRTCDTSGNSEWWLVTSAGLSGYVPSSFLNKYSEFDEFDDDKDDDDENDDSEDNACRSYFAQFEFEGTSPAELSVDEGQVVTVLQFHDIQGNDEWWLVEAGGRKGYVAANFLAPLKEQQ